MRRSILINILQISIYILIYYSFVLIFFGFSLEDSITRVYDYAHKRDRREIGESVRNQKIKKIVKIVASTDEERRDKDDKLESLTSDLASFDSDSKYRNKEIDKYIREVKVKKLIRKLKILCEIVMGELFQLIPLIVLVFTANIFYAIIASGIVMALYSIFQEYNLSKNMEFMYGEEATKEIMSQGYTKFIIILTSMVKQLYFYALLFLI